VRASYDQQWGYPRTITLVRSRHPDWFNPWFWQWFVTSGAWQECDNLTCTNTQRKIITIEMER
jgi:hypothetical protein